MAELDLRATEFVLFAGGAVMTVAVLVLAVVLYRHASREHRQQLERERQAPPRKESGE
jgi:hypothetical protein